MNKTQQENVSIVVTIFLLFCTLPSVTSEVYTAVADLEGLLQTESYLIDTLEGYIRAEEQKLDNLKRYAQIYRSHHDKASIDVQLYVANPINAYSLVKRLTLDWGEVEDLIDTIVSADYVTNITYIKETMPFPTTEDLDGAVEALIRLQQIYHLDTSSLARGELNGQKYGSDFSAADCFELGRHSYNNEDYYHTQLWMQEAESRLDPGENEAVDRSDILEYLAISAYEQGNITLALDLTNKLLEILPTHSRALDNKFYYEYELQESTGEKNRLDEGSESVEEDELKPSLRSDSCDQESYEQLCRGEISLPLDKSSKLRCRYVTRNSPFLLIAPFKVEEAHHDPDIYVFHGVLSDSEISTIKQLAQPRFERAGGVDFITGETDFGHFRISKSGWLKDEEHKHIADVSRRVSDMTGLTMETAEELQVVNYGIGGHYEPHYDFSTKEEMISVNNVEETGERIATVLFYMSDLEQGGATVFPIVNVSVWPQKGTAAFWYNLHPSGDGDRRTLHGACPVLTGSKWVSNKWIRERGQEFLRPCTSERPSEDLVV